MTSVVMWIGCNRVLIENGKIKFSILFVPPCCLSIFLDLNYFLFPRCTVTGVFHSLFVDSLLSSVPGILIIFFSPFLVLSRPKWPPAKDSFSVRFFYCRGP
jgi:hypothetical protein